LKTWKSSYEKKKEEAKEINIGLICVVDELTAALTELSQKQQVG